MILKNCICAKIILDSSSVVLYLNLESTFTSTRSSTSRIVVVSLKLIGP